MSVVFTQVIPVVNPYKAEEARKITKAEKEAKVAATLRKAFTDAKLFGKRAKRDKEKVRSGRFAVQWSGCVSANQDWIGNILRLSKSLDNICEICLPDEVLSFVVYLCSHMRRTCFCLLCIHISPRLPPPAPTRLPRRAETTSKSLSLLFC